MKETVVALGTFDGVHPGHRAILSRTAELAQRDGRAPLIYTFSHHPMAIFGKKPPLLMRDEARLALLRTFSEVAADDFTPSFAAMEPEAFVKMLMDRFNMRCAVAGYNYTFGNRGAGDTQMLEAFGRRLGFDVEIVSPVLCEGEALSSTRIRAALEAGAVAKAAEMLGRPYALAGPIRPNKRIGRSIGFPTANIEGFEGLVIPLEGVYATRAHVLGVSYPAVTNVGSNPTVRGERVTIETHLIGFEGELYGEEMEVSFVERLRGEVKFENLDTLRACIAKDVQRASKMLKIQ